VSILKLKAQSSLQYNIQIYLRQILQRKKKETAKQLARKDSRDKKARKETYAAVGWP
jgi:hypothetical protein